MLRQALCVGEIFLYCDDHYSQLNEVVFERAFIFIAST